MTTTETRTLRLKPRRESRSPRRLHPYGLRSSGSPGIEAIWKTAHLAMGFVHKDGKGFNVVLEALPVSGRVVLRLNQPKPKGEKE